MHKRGMRVVPHPSFPLNDEVGMGLPDIRESQPPPRIEYVVTEALHSCPVPRKSGCSIHE